MTTPKFTPGPLVVSHERNKFDSTFDSLTVIAPDGIVLATINVPAFAPHLEEPIANANLYASAPDLYAALEGLIEWAECQGMGAEQLPIFTEASAALALARGGVVDGQGVGADSGRGEKGGEVK